MLQLWVLILWCQHRVAWTAASIATGLSPCVFGDLGVYGHGVAALGGFFLPQGALTVWALFEELERRSSRDHGPPLPKE